MYLSVCIFFHVHTWVFVAETKAAVVEPEQQGNRSSMRLRAQSKVSDNKENVAAGKKQSRNSLSRLTQFSKSLALNRGFAPQSRKRSRDGNAKLLLLLMKKSRKKAVQ